MLKELRAKMEAKRKAHKEVLEKAKTEKGLDFSNVDALPGSTSMEKVKAFRVQSKEMTDLGIEIEALEAVEADAKAFESEEAAKDAAKEAARKGGINHPVGGKVTGEKALSFGEALIKSGAHLTENRHKEMELPGLAQLKTLFQTSAGWAAESLRTGRIVEEQVQPIDALDLFPMGQTSMAAVVYMEETTYTSNAAEASEGGTYGENAFALTEQSSTVRKIAAFIPVTDEQLEDVAQVQGYLNRRMIFSLRQRLNNQVLNGDGIAPNLEGILNVSGILTQAKGTDPIPSIIHKAMTQIRVTGRANPSGVIMHPNDWQTLRLERTTDGIYIWGHPSAPGPDRLWGLPVAQSTAITAGTSLVGDFAMFTEIVERRGIQVKISDSHSDYFIKGKQAIRADMRVALPTYRPAAFCDATVA